MSSTPINPFTTDAPDDFLALVDSFLCDDCTDAELAELNAKLDSNPAARQQFAAYCTLCRFQHEAVRGVAKADGDRQQVKQVDAHSSGVRTKRSAIGNRQLTIYALAAALLLSAAAVAIYVFVINPQSEIRNPKSDAPRIATLIDATGDVFAADDIAYPGAEITARTVSIASGSADLLLNNRVAIELTGDTALTLHSNMAATLVRGTADFNCPSAAKGYTVYLPGGARVVDLGTRFRIDIADDGAPEVRVTQGHVQLHGADRVIDITADRGWRIDPVAGFTPVAIEVPLVNADFESPALPDFDGRNHKPVDDWQREGVGLVSVYNPDAQFYPDSRDRDPDGGVLPGMSGPQALFMYGKAVGHAEQTTPHRIMPGERYELTVAVGRRNDIRNIRRAPGSIELRAGDRVLARADLPPESDQPVGTFVDFSMTWIPDADTSAIGQPLTVRLARAATHDTAYIDIDNVRLTHRPAPPVLSPLTPAQGEQP